MPAMSSALPVCAATMPAMAVPWPFESAFQTAPSTKDAPETMLLARSGCVTSTPVSRTATVDDPVGTTEPYTWSQPILASDHWLA